MADLTTLSNVKAWLGIGADETADDGLLARLISSTSDLIENELGEKVPAADYTDRREVCPGNRILPAHLPIIGVTSLTIDGESIPVSAGGSAGYSFDRQFITIRGYAHCRSFDLVLTYRAGNETVPPAIEQACIDWVAYRYRGKERIGQRSKGLAGETVTFLVDQIPPEVKRALDAYPWRRVSI